MPTRKKRLRNNPQYQRYLRSPAWREKRAKLIAERNYQCERCGCRERLDVHHKTYARVFVERDDDLEVLCRQCHDAEHHIKPPKWKHGMPPEKLPIDDFLKLALGRNYKKTKT